MSLKFNIDKFDGTGDFGIWRKKVKALLSQQKILKAIEGPDKLSDSLNAEQKDDMLEMALGTIILNLSDNVLREVNDETTAFDVWKKLEGLYLTKSLTNKIYLKECLFSFKMDPSKGLGQNLDEFKRMTIELANAGENEKLSDENEAIILLNSLPDSFRYVKAAIKYGRTSLSLDECISALKSKDLELKTERKDNDLWGPSKVSTHGGNRYFLSLIDDHSRKVWIYLLKSKDQAFENFKAWKRQVENQTSKTIKVLRTDNGLEFCNEEFNSFCNNEGIIRHKTVRHTP
ncbi:hypothetical protein EZV62_003182 [Acer yangbiense]|uniref:Integrase catalytic domain-containing protein n=1 Tax=Acer yangbiense TaxID=1000413 RepID=A0A5C7IG07_9ROSI|nr:hypothetical protein EZV62_003182 [Acer yangbiense]